MRDELHLTPGEEVDVTVVGGRIEIEPAPVTMRLEHRGAALAAVADQPMPPLTATQVRETLDQIRR